ncbi:ATP-dependent exoDNAse (exonuclease V) beta subunit [Lewinella marina]|uniref:DNA 3'-5' helicase n=1 Tax=Neolewinella marina TaxID=438751 RepID=A0A2G0CFP6_9BACT|nr:UvrD-helicase domain-containing protein [Neolewinella marina]NJB85512.1 ATP-dependent exoDNAse (exonuclease V) beta subunit [Neolewinella marina]PHK98799.1 DNA helicase UvrD [Neolewinella marina]
MLQNLKLISAGAGSGKTYRLTREMADLLTTGSVRPSGIIATTFTKRAAAELKERVRVALLKEGMSREANELTNALIGTVHGLGVKLLRRFAYEAGVSPKVDIIADGDDQRLFNLSMAAVISLDQIRRIEHLCTTLGLSRNGEKYNWRKDVLGLVEIIRGNNFSEEDIARSKRLSWETLSAFLPTPTGDLTLEQYHVRMARELKETYRRLFDNEADGTKKTETAALYLRNLLAELKERDYLPWLEYAKLGKFTGSVGAKSRDLVTDLVALAERHPSLKAFQDDIRSYQDLLFDVARDAIAEYDQYKKKRGRIDYTDMEVLVLELLDHPRVQQTLREELDLLMVDEFQDTSPIQLAIFLRLSELARQSIWVGDPKQSIYGFRGAEPRLMAAVMQANGPIDPANIQRQSWRSREDLVYACNSLFVNAFPDIAPEEVSLEPVRLRAGSRFSPPESPELAARGGLLHWHFEPEGKGRHSATFMQSTLAKAIRELLANPPPVLPKGQKTERRLRAGDIAILCRNNYGCAAVAAALADQGIPAAIARDGLLATAEATLLLACLKYMLNPGDTLSVAEIMLFGSRQDLPDIIDHRLRFLESQPESTPWGSEEDLIGRLDELRAVTSEHSTSEMLNIVLERLDLRRIAVAWGDGEQRLSNLDELRRLAVAYEDSCHRQHTAASLGGYLLYLDRLLRESNDKQGASERPDAVNVLTYHRSKGLEWPAVICFDLDQSLRAEVWGRAVVPDDPAAPVDLHRPLANRWLRFWVKPYERVSAEVPWIDALNESCHQQRATEDALAEEARLLYVGMTRARDYLILPTGKPGAGWVNRAYGRGGNQTDVLAPDTTETPFSWNGVDVDKYYQHWVEPRQQPAYPMSYRGIPFLDQERNGRQPHSPLHVDEAFLLNHYSGNLPGDTLTYGTPPDLGSGVDVRLYGRCVSIFLAGDPGCKAEPEYRHELAEQLIADFGPGAEAEPETLLQLSEAFHAFHGTRWPQATLHAQYPLRGTVGNRRYDKCIDWLFELETGGWVLFYDVCLSPKQFQQQAGLKMAELKLQAELAARQLGGPVSAAYLHFPVQSCLNEIKL